MLFGEFASSAKKIVERRGRLQEDLQFQIIRERAEVDVEVSAVPTRLFGRHSPTWGPRGVGILYDACLVELCYDGSVGDVPF